MQGLPAAARQSSGRAETFMPLQVHPYGSEPPPPQSRVSCPEDSATLPGPRGQIRLRPWVSDHPGSVCMRDLDDHTYNQIAVQGVSEAGTLSSFRQEDLPLASVFCFFFTSAR